ncbi:MAG: SO_0444 family Cu/Zn efflux transporter [Gammaproteobacteria bacterium]|nr:SO_0444 family Cu/Zn efflux transporter [Gammaproteobacteria bacterium]
MHVVTGFIEFLWLTFLLLAPMLLLGLFLSGVMHVFISREAILRWFRRDGLKTVATSAAIGVPMPLCSCSVVPVVAEMRRKGASRSACMSFLITAPETGADSILVTNAFFGPVVAVVRPFVSFVTAVVSGLFCIGLLRDSDPDPERPEHESVHEHAEHCSDCEHDHEHTSLFSDRDDCYVSLKELGRFALNWFGGLSSRSKRSIPLEREQTFAVADHIADSRSPDFWTVVKHVFRYGFVEVADDILFALLVGITLGGLLYFVIPSDLMAHEHAQWFAYPVMLLIGVPLYICASASTPIAAALVAKGVSPGAALVFLMTGPATNTGTIAIIVSQFGARFTTIYVVGVIAVTVILGVAIDVALLTMGISIAVNLEASDSHTILALQWGGAVGLAALIIWRFKAGALRSGFDDLMVNLRPMGRRVAAYWRR